MQVLPDVSSWNFNGTHEMHGQEANLWVYEQRQDSHLHAERHCRFLLHTLIVSKVCSPFEAMLSVKAGSQLSAGRLSLQLLCSNTESNPVKKSY